MGGWGEDYSRLMGMYATWPCNHQEKLGGYISSYIIEVATYLPTYLPL
jgi:hypothetical protein